MKTKFMVVGRSRIIAPAYGNLSLGGAVLEEIKSLRILGVTLDSKLTFESHCRKSCQRLPGVWVSCAEQAIYLTVHVCSRDVSLNMFCPA